MNVRYKLACANVKTGKCKKMQINHIAISRSWAKFNLPAQYIAALKRVFYFPRALVLAVPGWGSERV